MTFVPPWIGATALAAGTMGGGGPTFPNIPGTFNFTPANNQNFLAAMRLFKAGTGVPIITAMGNSTVAGFGGDPGATGWLTVRKDKNWVSHLADQMAADGIAAQQKNIIGQGGAGANFANYILPWLRVLGGAAVTGTLSSIGGTCLIQITLVDVGWTTVTFDGTAGNGAYITWLQFTAAGAVSFDVSFDGGATTAATIGSAGNNGIVTTFVANPGLASNAVSFRRVANPCHILGVEVVDTTAPACRVLNCGIGSTFTTSWLVTTNAFSVGNVYFKTGASLAIIDLTINDRSTTADPTVPVANLLTMRNALLAVGCDTWILVPPPGNNCTAPVLAAYHAAILAMCAANNITCVDLMDPLATLLDWQTALMMFDGIHPNNTGYAYIGATRLKPMVQAVYDLA